MDTLLLENSVGILIINIWLDIKKFRLDGLPWSITILNNSVLILSKPKNNYRNLNSKLQK